MTEPYPDEMFEEAERREAENKALDAVDKLYKENGDALQQLAEIERREFYRFFVVEYFGTGEGISYWLRATRNYQSHDGVDRELESFKEFVGESFFFSGIEEPTEEYFRTQYAKLIPEHVSKMLDRKDQPGFIWDAHFHVNYS
jgi:hypothetical protein